MKERVEPSSGSVDPPYRQGTSPTLEGVDPGVWLAERNQVPMRSQGEPTGDLLRLFAVDTTRIQQAIHNSVSQQCQTLLAEKTPLRGETLPKEVYVSSYVPRFGCEYLLIVDGLAFGEVIGIV